MASVYPDSHYATGYASDVAEETAPIAATPYWLHPFFLVVCCLGLPALVTYLLPAAVFESEWHTPKVYDTENALSIAYAIAAFAAGMLVCWFWKQHSARSGYVGEEFPGLLVRGDWMRGVFFVCAGLTLMGSAVWAIYSAQQGVGLGDAVAALRGDPEAVMRIRAKAATIPGITTFTQMGMAASILAGLLWFRDNAFTVRGLFIVIVIAAFLRAFLRAERLAFIEVIVPFGVALLPSLIARWRSVAFRMLLWFVPLIAVVALIAFFIIAEAGRSYASKREAGLERGAVDYGANRIGGYYGTALNNGAFLLDTLPPARMPYFTLEWFWKFPGLPFIDGREMTGFNSDQLYASLASDMNIEFNNTSGIFCYEYDFGRTGLVVVAFFCGAAAFLVFRSYRRGGGAGLIFYPICVLAFMELARIPYLTSKRAFASVAVLLALVAFDKLLRISAQMKSRIY